MRSYLVLLAVILGLGTAQAQVDEKYFEIGSVSVEEETEVSPFNKRDKACSELQFPESKPKPKSILDGIDFDQVINLGSKAWAIIEKNQPVVNLKIEKADALPLGVQSWLDLDCWQVPESRTYRVTYKNFYGITVVNFKYRVVYTYGGSVSGQGQYLSQVTVLPAELDVAWGFRVDAEVRVANVTNAGTQNYPVGGIQMDLNWTVKTPLKYSETTESFYIRGDGLYKKLD